MVRQRKTPGERTKRGIPGPALSALALCWAACDCEAVERVTLEIGTVRTPAIQASGAVLRLDVPPQPNSSLPAVFSRIAHVHLTGGGTTYRDIDIGCTDLLV